MTFVLLFNFSTFELCVCFRMGCLRLEVLLIFIILLSMVFTLTEWIFNNLKQSQSKSNCEKFKFDQINYVDIINNESVHNTINNISSFLLPNNIIASDSTTPKDTMNYVGHLNEKQLSLQSLKGSSSNGWNSFRLNSKSMRSVRSLKSFRNGIDNGGVTDRNNSNSNNSYNTDHTCRSASRTSDSSSVDFVAFKAGKDGNDNDNGSRNRSRKHSRITQNSTINGGDNDAKTVEKMTIPHTFENKRGLIILFQQLSCQFCLGVAVFDQQQCIMLLMI